MRINIKVIFVIVGFIFCLLYMLCADYRMALIEERLADCEMLIRETSQVLQE